MTQHTRPGKARGHVCPRVRAAVAYVDQSINTAMAAAAATVTSTGKAWAEAAELPFGSSSAVMEAPVEVVESSPF